MFTHIYNDKEEANARLQVLLKTGIPMQEDEAIALCAALTKRMYILIGEHQPGQQYAPATRSPMNFALGDLLNQFCAQIEARLDAEKPITLCDPPSISIDANDPDADEESLYCGILADFKEQTMKNMVERIYRSAHKSVPEATTLPKHIDTYSPAELSENLWLEGVRMRHNQALDQAIPGHEEYARNQYRVLQARLDLEIYNCLAEALGADKAKLGVPRR